MKKYIGIGAIVLCMPLSVSALDFGSGFPFGDVDAFVQGIVSNATATSSSGGASGTSVVTGDSSASARVKTVINSANGSSTYYKVEVRTETDGVVRTETIERSIPSGGSMETRIATSGSAKVGIEVAVNATSTPKKQYFRTFWNRARAFFGFF